MNLTQAHAWSIFSPRFVGREIPRAVGKTFGDVRPKRNILRFHPQSYDCGISRRGKKEVELSQELFLPQLRIQVFITLDRVKVRNRLNIVSKSKSSTLKRGALTLLYFLL